MNFYGTVVVFVCLALAAAILHVHTGAISP
jgi:hypothetical protein